MPLPTDPYRRAAQEQADAERLVAQQKRTAERLASAQQKQAAREQKAAADAARKAELSRQELNYRAQGMIPVTTADGNLHEDPLFKQKQAEKAAKEKTDAEAAQLSDRFTREGRKFFTSKVTGLPVPLESDAQLEEQRKARADKARRAALDERIQALETTATDPAQKRLPASAREKLTKQLAKTQQEALFGLQATLQEQVKAVSGGNDWIPFNEAATPEAQAAQERLTRLSQPDAQLTEDDLAALEANDATKPHVQKLRNIQSLLAKDDEAAKFHEQTAGSIFDLKLRRDNPAAWAERQRQRRAGMTPEQLAADLESSSADLTARGQELDAALQPILTRRTATQQKLDDLRQQAAQRRQQGLTAGEMVTMTNPDGTAETWPADLAAQFEKEQALHQQAEAQDAPLLEKLAAQHDDLQAEAALLSEGSTRLNEVNKVNQVQQAQSARRRFQFTPGMEQTGQALDALASEAQTRQQVLAEMHPDGIPQEALDALNADIQAKTEALITAGESKLQGAAQAAAQIRQRLDAREFEGKDASPAYAEAAAQLAQQTGITPEEAQRLITDAESATDWTNTYGRHEEGDTPGQTRLLSNGGIVVNPSITAKDAYEKAVAASGATPEAQADAIARYPQVREAAAKQVLESIQEIGSVGGPGAIADYTAHAAKRPGDLSEAEWAMRYVENEKANARSDTWNTLKSITREAWASLNQGAIDLRQQASGLLGALTGSETLMQDAQWAGRKADAQQQVKVLSGDQSTNIVASAAFSSIPRLAASILPAAKGAQALTGGVRLFAGTSIGARLFPSLAAAIEGSATPAQAAKAVDTLTRAGLGGASAAGAAQTYGAQMADIYGTLRREQPELSHTEALQQAQAPAVVSALATAALTTLGGSSGVERLFTRPQEARAAFDKVFASRLQQAGFVGKEFLKGGLKESFLEELPDEMISQIAAAVGTEKPVQQALAEFLQQLPELALATTALGGFGQGVSAAMDSSVNPNASQPEIIAPAWAAIENHVATDATGQVDQVLTEQQQRRAALALSLAQGGELFDVEAADLAAAGWTRDGDKFKPLKDYTGPQVLDIDSGGLPVIKDSYIAALRQTGLAPVADAIGMTETQTRNFYAQRNNPTTPDQNTPAGSQQPQQTGGAPAPAGSRPDANPSPVQAPTRAGNEPARSGSSPAPSGNAVSDAGTPARNDTAAPATVAETLANHLAERGLDRPAAAAAAEDIAARPEFDGMSYEQIIAEGPKFRAALDDLGIAGSLNSKDVATNPLKIQPGGRLEKVKAEMEAKAEAAKAAADPFASDAGTPARNAPDFAALREKVKNREISDRDAARQVAEAVGATTHEAFVAAMQQHLGWKPLRAEIAAHSHFGTKDQSDIPMASAGRASNRTTPSLQNSTTPSRDGPDTSLAADPSPLRKNRAYAADKLRVLAGIKDPSKKAWARQFFTALEQSLQRHHTLYDAYAVGGPARRHLDGQMTAVLEVEGKITRLIDLDAMVAQFDYLQSPQDALRATSIEEDIHAAVLQLARENPQEYGYASLRQKWQLLPADLKQTVWQAYRAANQNTASASEARMPKLKPAQEWHMMNEFVRMLVQDASFAGAITETVDPASGLIGWVQDLLKNLSRLLKNLMKKVQPDLRANLDRMVAQISARLAQIEQASAAQKDRLAVLPSLRDPAAYATTVLQQLGTAENAGILSDAALARVFDQLDPALQSRAFALWKSDAGTPARKAPKHALLRSLLAQFLGSRADSQRLATALAGMQSPPKTTGLLTKIMDRLLDRVQAPEVLDLIAAQSPKARRDLKNLHIATLRAIGGLRAASFVHDLGTKPGLVTALESPAVNPVTEVNDVTSETAERRRADFLAALAAREQDHEDARNDENQLKLRQRLYAEESANPALEAIDEAAKRTQQRLADFLAALDERDRQIELDHRDASMPAAGPALRRKLRQEELAYHHQLSYLRGEALAQIQLLTDQRRLPDAARRQLFDLLQVAAGRFEGKRPADLRLAGFSMEQALQRLGLRITERGTLITTDPVNTAAYVERGHVIIRQETLDTVADLVPAVAAFLHFRLGSEYDQRQKHGLPTFSKPQPQTTEAPESDAGTPARTLGSQEQSTTNEEPAPTFTPLAEGQSPFAANVAPVSPSPSLPVSPSPALSARVPLGGRNSLPAQFASAEDLAAFQYQLDRDALLREGTSEKDRNAARDRITALRARLIDETGASKEEVEQKLADYHRAVIDAAKKADPVEVFRPVSFSNFLRARGTQAKADTLVAPEGGDLISALQGRVKRIGKISQSRTAGEWDWYRQLQQQVQAENAGRPLSRRQLQQAQKAAQNGDVSTPLNLLQWINLNVVDADKGMPIDEAATALSDTGKLDENDPNAQQPFDVDGTSLGEAILAAIDARVALRDQGGDPALRQEAEALRQGSDFRAVAEGAPGRAFTGSELAARLQPGDEIQLGTEWLTVTDVDTEEGTIALDSDRYGPQGLDPSQTIHLLAIGDEPFNPTPPPTLTPPPGSGFSQSPSLPVSQSSAPSLSPEVIQALQTALPPGQRDFLAPSAIERTLKPLPPEQLATPQAVAQIDADLRASIDAGEALDASLPAGMEESEDLAENADDWLDGDTALAAATRSRRDATFEPGIKTPFGTLLRYSWMHRSEDVFNPLTGEVELKRVSDWDKALTNAETGREIVHHFTVSRPDGTTQTVSLETALGAMTAEQKKSTKVIIRALRRLPVNEALLAHLKAKQVAYLAAVDEAYVSTWKQAPDITLSDPDFAPLRESGVKAGYIGKTFVGNFEPSELPLSPAKIQTAKVRWALETITTPKLTYDEQNKLESLPRIIKKDREDLRQSGTTSSGISTADPTGQLPLFSSNRLAEVDPQRYFALDDVRLPVAKQPAASAAIAAAGNASGEPYPAQLPANDGKLRKLRESLEQRRADALRAWRGLTSGDKDAIAAAFEQNNGRISSLLHEFIQQGIPGFDIRGAVIENPQDFAAYNLAVRTPYFESVKIAVLGDGRQVIHSQIVHVGSLNESIFSPVLIAGIIDAARLANPKLRIEGFLIAHNHPSGDTEPSDADKRSTNRLRDIADTLDVPFLDHVITNGSSYFSFRENGLLYTTATLAEGSRARKPKLPVLPTPYAIPSRFPYERESGILADWEVVPSGDTDVRPRIDQPWQMRPLLEKIGTADPLHHHLLYFDTRNKLRAVERIPADTQNIAALAITGAAREGASGIAIGFAPRPTSTETAFMTDQERRVHFRLREALQSSGIKYLDAGGFNTSSQEAWSAAEMGLMEETTALASAPRLSAFHNLSPENLAYADRIGGLAVPSIAVLPEGQAISGFGSITLIGTRDLVDPRKNPVFDADAYTARFPDPEYKRARTADAQALVNKLRPFERQFEDSHITSLLWDNAVNNPNPQDSLQRLQRSLTGKAAFLAEQGTPVEPIMMDKPIGAEWVLEPAFAPYRADPSLIKNLNPNDEPTNRTLAQAIRTAIAEYVRRTESGARVAKVLIDSYIDKDTGLPLFGRTLGIEKSLDAIGQQQVDTAATTAKLDAALAGREAAFQQWVERQILPIMGEPRLTLKGRKVPYTLDNIVQAMTSARVRGGENVGSFFGEGAARGNSASRFKDLEQMRGAAAVQIMPEEQVSAARETARKLLADWREAVAGYTTLRNWKSQPDIFGAFDAAMRAIARWAKGSQTPAALRAALQQEDFANVPDAIVEQGQKAAEAFAAAPVPYFESKPQRAVLLNEFVGAVIPDSETTSTTADILQRHGIPFRTYAGNAAQQTTAAQFAQDLADKGALFASARITDPPFSTPEAKALEESRIHAIDTYLHGKRRPIAETPPADQARSSRAQLPALLTHLRRSQRTGGSSAPDAAARRAADRRRDKALLTDWARDAGILITDPPSRYDLDGPLDKGGAEHHVFRDNEGRWVKITRGDGTSYGYQPRVYRDEWDIAREGADVVSYLEKLLLHNHTFHDDIVLHAVWSDRVGNVALITSQPHYQGAYAAQETAIKPAMEDAGFIQLDLPSAYYRPADNLAVLDLHTANAITQDNGTFLRVFDNIILHPTGALRATFERLATERSPLAASFRLPASFEKLDLAAVKKFGETKLIDAIAYQMENGSLQNLTPEQALSRAQEEIRKPGAAHAAAKFLESYGSGPAPRPSQAWPAGSIQRLLARMAQTSSLSPDAKRVAAHLASTIDWSKVEFRTRTSDEWMGVYHPATSDLPAEIVLETATTTSPEVTTAEYLLHEALHHATLHTLSDPQTDAQLDAIIRLRDLYHQAASLPNARDQYGMRSLSEFVAELGSNRQFQSWLRSHRSFWNKLLDTLRSLLGLPDSLTSTLDDLLAITEPSRDAGTPARNSDPLPSALRSPLATQVAAAASQTDPNPSDAQKRAGNYAKGKVDLHGLRISIENPAGSVRSGTDAAGKPWSITLPHHYGYILGSEGRDGDHVDVFIGPNPDSQLVLIINQRKPGNGHFDEHKVMLGFNTPAEAARGYMASYTKGWKGLGSAVPTTIPVFKHWLTTKDTTQPVTKEQLEKLAKTVPLPTSAHDKPAVSIDTKKPTPAHPPVTHTLPDGYQLTGPGLHTILPAAIRAHHGTPHEIDPRTGFSLNKVGTGEGAQVYGWGLYFAEALKVAEQYRKALSYPIFRIGDKEFFKREGPEAFKKWAITQIGQDWPQAAVRYFEHAVDQFYHDATTYGYRLDEASHRAKGKLRSFLEQNKVDESRITEALDALSRITDNAIDTTPYDSLEGRWTARAVGWKPSEESFSIDAKAYNDIWSRIGWYSATFTDAPARLKAEYEAQLDVQSKEYDRLLDAGKLSSDPMVVDTSARVRLAQAALDLLNSGKVVPEANKRRGNLYTVDLLGDPAEFLDWDRPMSDQSEKVRKALRELPDIAPLVDSISRTGEEIYRALSQPSLTISNLNQDPRKLASELLNLVGIKGVRYTDAGSRYRIEQTSHAWEVLTSTGRLVAKEPTEEAARAAMAKLQTYNYVLFDDKLVRIVEVNGKPVSESQSLPVSPSPSLAASNRLGTAITRTASAVASGTERTLQVANTLTKALGIQEPLATFGSNNLDKRLAAQLDKLAGPKIRSVKTAVETWLDKPDGLAPSIKGLVDQILPTALLPREWLALHHEMQRKSAYGQETANDLIRALSGNPRLSDLAYPKEFAENPSARAQLFDAMEGRIPMATLPPAMQRLGQRLRDLLRQTGSELVRQGLMNPDTFEELQTNGWMPRYTEDEARESAGSFLAAFKLGVRDLLQQRSTAYHIVDTTRKDKTGQFVTVSRDEGGKRNRWRFRDAASRDAFYHKLIRQHALTALQEDNKHPHTKTLLDALDAKTRREVRADIKKLTLDEMELTAKVSPALARLIKSALHHQADRFLPKDPFEPAKLVKDPVYAVARYVLGQTHNASTMELLRKTAAHPEWVSDVSLTGFTAIPDASRFGPLAGKHVRKDIAAQILDLVDVPNAGLQFYDAILRKWKAGKLVWNPGSHVRDAVGNTMFAYLAGSSIWNPGNWPYYQQAIAALRTGGKDFAELIEQQVIGGDAYTGLVKERLRGLLPDPKTVEGYNPGFVQRLLFGFGASLHGSHEFLASLRRLPDDLFKSAAYFKAKADLEQQGTKNEELRTMAAGHVRKWFPYYDRLGQSGTTRAVGRFVNPFVSFFRESTRILGTAVAERPLALTASLAFPAIITALSAMALGLDDDDMEQIQKDMAGKGKLFATDTPLFSMLLPFRSAQGAVQQFDISAIMPFADLLGTRVAVTDATEDPWNRFWRGIVAGGPVLSLIDAWRHNEDAFTRRPIAEFGMTPLEKLEAYTKHAAGVALPPLAPGGTAFNTLTRAGDRSTNKTLETYDPAQAVVRSVAGLNVKNATPDLYRLADDWRKAHGYEVTEGMDYGSTTPASRARKALFAQLAQDEPNLTAIGNILKRLAEMGHPVRTEQDVNKLLFYRDPLKLIGGNKAKGISPTDAQAQFRSSLQGEARQALENALQEFNRIKQRAPSLIRRATSTTP